MVRLGFTVQCLSSWDIVHILYLVHTNHKLGASQILFILPFPMFSKWKFWFLFLIPLVPSINRVNTPSHQCCGLEKFTFHLPLCKSATIECAPQTPFRISYCSKLFFCKNSFQFLRDLASPSNCTHATWHESQEVSLTWDKIRFPKQGLSKHRFFTWGGRDKQISSHRRPRHKITFCKFILSPALSTW